MKEQTTRTPPKLRVLSAFLAVAMLLNLAAPLALADSVKCTVAGVELTGDVDSVPTETKIAGQVSYLNNTLTFHGNGCLTFQGRSRLQEGSCGVLSGGHGYVRFPERCHL